MKKQYQDTALQPLAAKAAKAEIQKFESISDYQYKETRELIQLVAEAADLLRVKGEPALSDFRLSGSHWRQGESYIFVLDPMGNMLVHTDPELEGTNQLELKDVNGKPIIRGLLEAATTFADKPDGWYHYQWPVPGGLLPRWKSSYVRLVKTPTGKSYILGSGIYNDRMEKEFVFNLVKNSIAQIEKNDETAFRLFHDPKGPFMVKDTYVFVIDENGVELVNPGFPNLEGRNIMDVQDSNGKYLIREMFKVVQTSGSGWVDYLWPKPGESISTQKTTFVSKARIGKKWVLVGCGAYLADAPKVISAVKKMTASELMILVREAAEVLEQNGENAFPDFRKKGSKWFHDDIYFFIWSMDGIRVFHAEKPEGQGENVTNLKDVLGKPIGKMFLGTAATPEGEGFIHCMWPEPGSIFPIWKSSFVKRVTFPSGKPHMVGCGIYNMQLDKTLIEDLVNRAALLIEENGKDVFDLLRDKKGSFFFMDTYVFVDNLDGIELVNAGQPSIEGKNVIGLADAHGKFAARDYIDAAVKNGTAWVDYYWYRPGENTPAHKYTYVRKVKYGEDTYVVGAGLYLDEDAAAEIKEQIVKAKSDQ